jgi:hypothetical protein
MVFGRHPRRDRNIDRFGIALDGQRDRFTGDGGFSHLFTERVGLPIGGGLRSRERLAIDGGDHVAGLEARLCRRAVRLHRSDRAHLHHQADRLEWSGGYCQRKFLRVLLLVVAGSRFLRRAAHGDLEQLARRLSQLGH